VHLRIPDDPALADIMFPHTDLRRIKGKLEASQQILEFTF
jgi:hypothetical protein